LAYRAQPIFITSEVHQSQDWLPPFAAMDSATCNVIYVDRSVRAGTQITPTSTTEDIVAALGDAAELESSLSMLRDAFGEGTQFFSPHATIPNSRLTKT
jgi:hypothetical protein